MLPSKNRIRRSADIDAAMRRGRRAGREALSVAFLPPLPPRPGEGIPAGGGEPPPRVGFIVSRAVGGAVTRNRIRRQLRHLVRERLDALPAGSLLVVRAKPVAADFGHEMLATQLDGALAAVKRPRKGVARRRRSARDDSSDNTVASGNLANP